MSKLVDYQSIKAELEASHHPFNWVIWAQCTKSTILNLLKHGFDRVAIASALGFTLDQLAEMEAKSTELA